MTAPRTPRALAALAALAAASPAAEPKPAGQLVRELGHPAFAVREQASRDLWRLGPPALAALEAARADPDPEVAQRARDVLARFQSGIFPDTPPEALRWVREFRTGAPEKQQAAVSALAALPAATPSLRALLAREAPREARGELFQHFAWAVRREAPLALERGQTGRADELLELNALGASDVGLADYAARLARAGRAAEAVAAWDRRRAKPAPALVALCRAAGDHSRARLLAAALADADPEANSLLDALLEDVGAWGELADRSARHLGPANVRDGLTILRLQRAGRTEEADRLAARQMAEPPSEAGRTGPDPAAAALMLTGRPLDGIARLTAAKASPHVLADVLAARLEFRAALDRVDLPDARPQALADDRDTLAHLYGSRKGKILSQLGDRAGAEAVFEALAGKLTASSGDVALSELLRAELRAGRPDLACDHAGRLLLAADPRGAQRFGSTRRDPFEALFEADAEAGQFWWRTLRAAAPLNEPPGDTMKAVRALLIGQATAAARLRALDLAAREQPKPHPSTDDGYARAMGLAALHRAAGDVPGAARALGDAADELLKQPPDAEPEATRVRRLGRGSRSWLFGTDERFRLWMELGDLLMDAGDARAAANRYHQGWRRHPDCPTLLYLSGRALLNAGDADAGAARVALSHEIGLGNVRARGRFLDELAGRGLAADARVERDRLRDIGWCATEYHGNVWNQVARASVILKDFPAAADATGRAVHYVLRTPGMVYVDMAAYLTVPQGQATSEARARLAAGDADAALAKGRSVLAVLPGSLEVPLGLVPGLDRAGRTADADALFRQVWDRYRALAAEHPNSAWARQCAAWLAAGCRRELDAALADAREAVRLDPESRANREALAEVQFRRGDRASALALMRELFAADRRHHLYRRQLARYERGALDSPLPDVAEE